MHKSHCHLHDDRRIYRHHYAVHFVSGCRVPGCTRFAKEATLCLVHFRLQQRRFHDLAFTPVTEYSTELPTVQGTPRRRLGSLAEGLNGSSRNARCRFFGCSSYARNGGLCTRHGGGRKCVMENCKTPSQTGGLCRIHGGGSRCRTEGCTKFARIRGLCSVHIKLTTVKTTTQPTCN
ncbi:hypothetical protein Ae201684P_018485 [Aphanomyces euteiches]|nr:hypothetical protein Ae201684P_018485 [Aphanomyces euteiches]